MKVIFKTNIDAYQTNCFPENLPYPPRIGEKVIVNEVFGSYYINKNLPISLKVVDVIWGEKGVICELWYDEIDVKRAKLNNINLF